MFLLYQRKQDLLRPAPQLPAPAPLPFPSPITQPQISSKLQGGMETIQYGTLVAHLLQPLPPKVQVALVFQ